LLGDGDVAPGECEVVIGGEQGDQAEGEAADRLGDTKPVKTGPGVGDGRRGLQNINATIGFNSSQASMGAEASTHAALLRWTLASDQGECTATIR
jgi:hypothetical protein